MKLVYQYNAGDFSAAVTTLNDKMARAGAAAITEVTGLAKNAARASVAAGMHSNKWANAIQARVYPKGTPSLKAAGWVFSKIPYADVFQTGATISPKKDFLWLPLPTVPFRQGGHRMTPSQYVQFFEDKLIKISPPGKPPLLMGHFSRAGVLRVSSTSARLSKRARKSGKVMGPLVPLYVGVASVTETQKFDVRGAVALVVASQLNDLFLKNLED